MLTFHHRPPQKILLLLGGNKNGQDKDIKQAKKIYEKQLKLKIKEGVGVVEHNPLKELLDEKLIDAAIIECLKNNDPEGAMEVLRIYMNALNRAKTELFNEAELSKTTAYHSFRSKNPTLKTFSKLMYATHQRAENSLNS